MTIFSAVFVAAGWASVAAAAAPTATDMGPAAMLWPPDRPWSADKDNIAPCGTSAGVGNRTQFPLTGGRIALVDQNEGFDLKLSISYVNSPASNADFEVLIPSQNIKEVDPGHTCVAIANPPSNIVPGSNATFQIIYTAAFDTAENQTFYACSDVTYVLERDFSTRIPCFNATEPPNSSATATTMPSPSGSSGLSGGAIAGVVVGCVLGLLLLGAAALWFYRRGKKAQRSSQIGRASRGVNWDAQQHGGPKNSSSQNSVPLQDMH